MSDGMRRELVYLSSHATNRYFIPNWGNYFVCECVRHEGSSGSPLLNNNDVVGIMHGGYGNDECVFLSASAIIKALKEHHQFSK